VQVETRVTPLGTWEGGREKWSYSKSELGDSLLLFFFSDGFTACAKSWRGMGWEWNWDGLGRVGVVGLDGDESVVVRILCG
jgi:hypothetical protein